MTIAYKWMVESLKVKDTTNVVTQVFWRCDAEDDANKLSAACSGIRELVLGNTFVPYEQLTQTQVLDWCFAPETIEIQDRSGNVVETIVKFLKNDVEAQIADQITRQLAQKESTPALPWTNVAQPA
jgi:hypothetical protein